MGAICKQGRVGVGGMVNEICWTKSNRRVSAASDCKLAFIIDNKNSHSLKVNSREKLSFHNKYTFFKKIDQLPTGPEWVCNIVTITGNLVDDNGVPKEENVEVWRRDPVECIKELMGNPAFKDYMSYMPEHVYLDKEGLVQIYDEMWTADWWWNKQVSLL